MKLHMSRKNKEEKVCHDKILGFMAQYECLGQYSADKIELDDTSMLLILLILI